MPLGVADRRSREDTCTRALRPGLGAPRGTIA
jgi:hypothetical protein